MADHKGNLQMGTAHKYRAPALEKGLDILELLARTTVPMALSEISTGVGRSKSELFRMVQVLEGRGYLARAPGTEAYVLTNRLFLLGMEHPPIKGLVEVALPVMHVLAEDILQPCQLVVPSEEFIVVIARVDSPGDIGFVVRLGHRRPLPHSTSGLVLFSFQTQTVRERWLAMLESKEIRFDRKQMNSKAEAIQIQGHACIPSELVAGITDLSAPILQQGAAVAALTVPYVERRSSKVSQKESIKLLCKAAAQISRGLESGTR
jgi:DNA-binding IclR family transcriptional regulator